MSISVKCDACGQSYFVLEKHAGKSLPCKKCFEMIVVPAAEPDEDAYSLSPLDNAPPAKPAQSAPAPATASARTSASPASAPDSGNSITCFSCAARLPANSVLCISCGTNLKTGRKLKTKSSGADDHLVIKPNSAISACLLIMAVFFGCIAVGAFFVWEAMEKNRNVTLTITIIASLVFVNLVAHALQNRKRLTIVTRSGSRQLVIKSRLGLLRTKRRVNLADYDSVWYIQNPQEVGLQTMLWIVAAGLFLVGVLPGLLYWYWVLNSEDTSVWYRAELRGPGSKRRVLHRGLEWTKADVNRIVNMLHLSAGLQKEQELGLID